MKVAIILLAAIGIIAIPFLLRPKQSTIPTQGATKVLTIISPHNESIKSEFDYAFTQYYQRKHNEKITIDWRNIGGTTEIMRYLASEFEGSFRGYLERNNIAYSKDDPTIRAIFLTNDNPRIATTGIDIFFGGGTFDHGDAERKGFLVKPWGENGPPKELFQAENGIKLIPQTLAGDPCHTDYYYGNVLSTFGICANLDRLRDISLPFPESWADLTSPALFGAVGLADPTKSGSVAKAFEIIIHKTMLDEMHKLYTEDDISKHEEEAQNGKIDPTYEATMQNAWISGLNLVRLIGANAKYFTDSAGKVPIDTAQGLIACGVCIDFFGRFQSEFTKTPDGIEHAAYKTPIGGSCVSADTISLLRGAPHREIAVEFIEFTLSEEGQALWNGRIGTEHGPQKYSLRRLPIRRDFYPIDDPTLNARAKYHESLSSDDLSSPNINPYAISDAFTYRKRWTSRHFGIQRDLIRAMCLDSAEELKTAWKAIIQNGGPENNPKAMELLFRLPTRPIPVSWSTATTEYKKIPRLDYMREWTQEMRQNYREAAKVATK